MSLSFNGTDASISVADQADHCMDFGAGAYSILFWVKRNLDPGAGPNFMGKANYSGGWRGFSFEDKGDKTFQHINGAAGGFNQIIESEALTTGVWYHVAVTRAANGDNFIYINGVTRYSGTLSAYDVTTTNIFYLGRCSDSTYPRFNNCQLAEVMFFNVVLSLAKINSLRFRSIFAEANLVALYKLNENVLNAGPGGTTAVDLSGLKHDGDDNGTMSNANYTPAPPITPLQDFM